MTDIASFTILAIVVVFAIVDGFRPLRRTIRPLLRV